MALIPRPKFPRVIRLPFVPAIRVRYVTEKQLKALTGFALWGYWVDRGNGKPMIYVNKDAPLWDQVDTLWHEIDHAHTDLQERVLKGLVEPMKVEAGVTASEMREDEDE